MYIYMFAMHVPATVSTWVLNIKYKQGSTDYSWHDKVNYFTPQVPVPLERFLLGSL